MRLVCLCMALYLSSYDCKCVSSSLRQLWFSVLPEHTAGLFSSHHQRQSVAVTRCRTVTNDIPSQSNTYHRTGNTQAWK